ncbi:NUDIX hydrolase [Gemelliphila palaticanis]|nr:8-oxo-dGTP diphosphatase [Gemella palaticanis]
MFKLGSMCYIDNGDSFLMLKRNKKENDVHQNFIISVGGKIEEGETPEECIIREVKEETDLDITNPQLRGIITFPDFEENTNWYTYVFTCENFSGTITNDCSEGDLMWIKKQDILDKKINTWEGDFVFLEWIIKNKPFFSAKFVYENKNLKDYNVIFY